MLVLRDNETAPRALALDDTASPRFFVLNKAVYEIDAERVSLKATMAMELTPEQLECLGKAGSSKNPVDALRDVLACTGLLNCLDVVTNDGVSEIMLRTCADATFLATVPLGKTMAKHDGSRLRRLPIPVLLFVKENFKSFETSALQHSGRKILREALAKLEDGGGDARLDWTGFAKAKTKRLISASALAARQRIVQKRTRDDECVSRDMLTKICRLTQLPVAGQFAISFHNAQAITTAGATIIVTIAEEAEPDATEGVEEVEQQA